MKYKILYIVLIFLSINIFADTDFPEPAGYVNDFAGVLAESEEQALKEIIEGLERDTTSELAVVTIETVKPLSIEEYSVRLFSKWGIGKQGKDNGILLLVAISDREVKIEVGYGLEGVLPDGLCGEIIRGYIIPEFKNARYGPGIIAGVREIVSVISGTKKTEVSRGGVNPIVVIFLIFFAMVILQMLLQPRRRGLRGYGGSSYGSGGGSGFSGFGGGGFGGFGGGHSGGGGAVGRW